MKLRSYLEPKRNLGKIHISGKNQGSLGILDLKVEIPEKQKKE